MGSNTARTIKQTTRLIAMIIAGSKIETAPSTFRLNSSS